jgi:glycosyltransferase involved in cell wall biosynthesis
MPRVSVVMPVYNGEEHLEPAIESILNQTFRELELLIVDDGSTDGTFAVLQRYARSDSRVRVFRQDHSGIVAALNRGSELARAPYLARMDADDIAFPDRLTKQVKFLDQNTGVALVGGATERISTQWRRTGVKTLPTAPGEIATRLFAGEICIIHPTVVMRAKAFIDVGRYRSAFEGAEDYDLWLRMAERFELANLPDAVLAYRIHPGQVSARRLEQCVISCLAAQAASRIRRATGQDPTQEEPQVGLATLRRLGVGHDVVRGHLIKAYRRNFRVFLEAGNPEGALRLFQENAVPWKVRRALRTDYTLALLRQAKRDYAERRLIRGSLSILRACLVRPSLPLSRLAARAWSVLAT